jgi:predicted AAA+ superfamily ATPase
MSETIDSLLARIADALDRLAPPRAPRPDLDAAEAFVWRAEDSALIPVPKVNRIDLGLLRGIDLVRDQLVENTARFACGLPANNALLWGARGMGKSSLVKAVHADVNAGHGALKLIEIHREDIASLPVLMGLLRDAPGRFIVFCDDLSFDSDDTSYKSLKAALEGGIEGRPTHVIFYATSNRRHLLPRDMMENERSTAINPGEAVEEKSLAVRSLRPVARFPPLQPGRISVDGLRVRRPFRPEGITRGHARRCHRMGRDARRKVGPHGVAIYSGSRGTVGATVGVTLPPGSLRRDCERSEAIQKSRVRRWLLSPSIARKQETCEPRLLRSARNDGHGAPA